jgi:hypothetical protein
MNSGTNSRKTLKPISLSGQSQGRKRNGPEFLIYLLLVRLLQMLDGTKGRG